MRRATDSGLAAYLARRWGPREVVGPRSPHIEQRVFYPSKRTALIGVAIFLLGYGCASQEEPKVVEREKIVKVQSEPRVEERIKVVERKVTVPAPRPTACVELAEKYNEVYDKLSQMRDDVINKTDASQHIIEYQDLMGSAAVLLDECEGGDK